MTSQWLSYKEKVQKLSSQLVLCQKPIRILDAIKVRAPVRDAFEKSKFKEIPLVPADMYSGATAGFDLDAKEAEFRNLLSDVHHQLGKNDHIALLLQKIIEEYINVLGLLKNRGKKEFYEFSKRLYGSTRESLFADKNTVFEMSKLLYQILSGIKNSLEVPESEKIYSSEEAVKVLNDRFKEYFGESVVRAEISDGILADASAGGDKVKLRAAARFSPRELSILEVHEGWVHVGTTMNGKNQPVAKWLSVGPPRCAATQEGLAVLMEIFTFRSSVKRAQQINDRIIAIAKVEDGANLLEIFEYFRTEGYTEEECVNNTFRIFRGAPFGGGCAFTKDISYCKGFVENYNFIRAAIRAHKPFLIPFLFAGKLNTEDLPLLYHLHKEGVVQFPKFLPKHFSDINGIAVWMSFSSFFNKVDLKSVQKHYNKLFAHYSI